MVGQHRLELGPVVQPLGLHPSGDLRRLLLGAVQRAADVVKHLGRHVIQGGGQPVPRRGSLLLRNLGRVQGQNIDQDFPGRGDIPQERPLDIVLVLLPQCLRGLAGLGKRERRELRAVPDDEGCRALAPPGDRADPQLGKGHRYPGAGQFSHELLPPV